MACCLASQPSPGVWKAPRSRPRRCPLRFVGPCTRRKARGVFFPPLRSQEARAQSLYCVHSVIVLDSDGGRIASRYYAGDLPSLKEQHAFEASLHAKTRGAFAEVVMLDRTVAVYRSAGDVTLYVLGGHDDNELVLQGVLDTMFEALEALLRGHISKRSLLDNYDVLLLVADETVDRGVVLETGAVMCCVCIYTLLTLSGAESSLVVSRVAMSDRPAALTPLHEQSVAQIFDMVKGEVIRNLVRARGPRRCRLTHLFFFFFPRDRSNSLPSPQIHCCSVAFLLPLSLFLSSRHFTWPPQLRGPAGC